LETDDRPLITFAVFAYNQVRWVRAAVEAALAQTWTPLQIILSDDGSTDGTFAIMEELAHSYHGPHQVQLNRNPRNLGIGGHVNRVMELVAGDLVVVAAGDDISVPHRTQTLVGAWQRAGRQARSLHSAVVEMDGAGRPLRTRPYLHSERLNDAIYLARHGVGVLGASHAWAREVFETFGPLMPELVREDIAISFRSALLGHIEYVSEPLVHWRVGFSGWHDMHAASVDVDEMRRRSEFNLRLAYIDARQASLDVARVHNPLVAKAVRTRHLEFELMYQIARGERIRPDELITAVRAGASLWELSKCAFKHRSRHVYALALKLRTRAQRTREAR